MGYISLPAYIVLAFVSVVVSTPTLSRAEEAVCAFSAQEHGQDYTFSVASRPSGECKSQSLKIAVQHNAKLVAQFETNTDKLIETVWVNDLDEDGRPELILISRTPANPARVTLSVYVLDGTGLKAIPLPEPPDKEGYRGGDQFSRDAGKIVRTYMVYRNGDRDGVPTGGKRVVSYRYRDRQLLPVVQSEVVVKEGVSVRSKNKTGNNKVASFVKVTAINVKSDYVEIVADGALENYKVTRIADPWRLIIDIPAARSAISPSSVAINKFGISNARIAIHKGKLRIVLDSSAAILPPETVTPAEKALRIGFYSGDK